MTVTRYNGWIILSQLVNGELITRKYMGYTLKECKAKFNADIRELEN